MFIGGKVFCFPIVARLLAYFAALVLTLVLADCERRIANLKREHLNNAPFLLWTEERTQRLFRPREREARSGFGSQPEQLP